MSFMAGFGPAFSRAFEGQRERSAKRKDDLFEKTYENLLKRKTEYEKAKEEDTRLVGKAKSYVKQTGQPDEAWTEVYKWLKEGQDDSHVLDQLQTGKFSVVKRGGETVVSEKPIPAPPIDAQMQEAIPAGAPAVAVPQPQVPQTPQAPMQTVPQSPQTPQTPEPPAEKQGVLSRVLGEGPNFLGRSGSVDQQNADEAMNRAAQAAGIPTEEARKYLTETYQPTYIDTGNLAFEPAARGQKFLTQAEALYRRDLAVANGDMAEAKQYQEMVDAHSLADDLDAAKKNNTTMFIVRDPETGLITHTSGQRVDDGIKSDNGKLYEFIRPVADEEIKQWFELGKSTKGIEEFKKLQSDTASAYEVSSELLDIVNKNRDVLTVVGGITPAMTGTLREVDALVNLGASLSTNPNYVKKARELEASITKTLLSGAVRNAAEARALINSKLKLAAYRFGKMEGQEGRDISNFDIARLDQIIKASSDPKVFAKNLNDYMEELENKVNSQATQFNQNNQTIGMLKEIYQYSPMETVVPEFQDYLAQTGMKKYYDSFKSNPLLGNQVEVENDGTGELGGVKDIPAGAIEMLKSSPSPEYRKYFDEIFGEGAAAKVLGQ